MKWHRIIAVLASFLLVMVSAFAADPFPLTRAGGDPCNPKAGCTLKWALEQSGWPAEVQRALTEKVKVAPGGESKFTIPLDYRLWMTAGKHRRKFWPEAITKWKEGPQPSIYWSHRHDGLDYFLFNVNICKNWAGATRKLAPRPPASAGSAPAAAARAASSAMTEEQANAILGAPFQVSCPDTETLTLTE